MKEDLVRKTKEQRINEFYWMAKGIKQIARLRFRKGMPLSGNRIFARLKLWIWLRKTERLLNKRLHETSFSDKVKEDILQEMLLKYENK